MDKSLERAKAGYEAYAKSTGGKTYDGKDMPKWDEVPQKIKDAWNAAATAIAETEEGEE